jgi:hypothetical protein
VFVLFDIDSTTNYCTEKKDIQKALAAANTQTSTRRSKPTDEGLKRFAMDSPLSTIINCNAKTCEYGGSCVTDRSIGQMQSIQQHLWGSYTADAPTAKVRKGLIQEIIRSAYVSHQKKFVFSVTNKKKDNDLVCEAGYLILAGLIRTPNASHAPNQWKRCKEFMLNPEKQTEKDLSMDKCKRVRTTKLDDCKSFIKHFVNTFGDTVPGPAGGELI